MARLGRNDPCRCGSGKKYKKCCLRADETAERAQRRAAHEQAETQARADQQRLLDHLEWMRADDAEHAAYIDESNAILELIHTGQLDDAEARARALIVSVPEGSDGHERLGHVYEARGDMKTAAKHYRKAIALVRGQGLPEDDHLAWLRELADRIDPPALS
jgi:tetratricopeptide (TPR) repeat protein